MFFASGGPINKIYISIVNALRQAPVFRMDVKA